jgi:uncharacterized protein (DUF305 family)
MNNDKLIYGVTGLILGVLLMWIFTSYGVNGKYGGMMGMRSNIMGNVDEHFIEQMIPHHDDAITMANMGLQKAEHQEIKDLSKNIIKAQTEENNKMSAWYKDWFGTDVPDRFAGMGNGMGGMIHNGMMGNATDISDLESAQPFDKEFIEEMIPHHQMAVMMAQMLEQSTTRSEMKKLAQDIIRTQNEEIEQMRNWYSQWYK